MKFWDFLEKEAGELKREFHLDPLEERTWSCKPLLVVDVETNEVAFVAHTRVNVVPLPDGTYDLAAEGDRDGWHPSLKAATVTSVMASSRHYHNDLNIGFRCEGADEEGNKFVWYVNGAASERLMLLDRFTGKVLPPEDPDQDPPELDSPPRELRHKPKRRT